MYSKCTNNYFAEVFQFQSVNKDTFEPACNQLYMFVYIIIMQNFTTFVQLRLDFKMDHALIRYFQLTELSIYNYMLLYVVIGAYQFISDRLFTDDNNSCDQNTAGKVEHSLWRLFSPSIFFISTVYFITAFLLNSLKSPYHLQDLVKKSVNKLRKKHFN